MMHKFVVLTGALLAQVTIAGLYAWSIFSTALQAERGWGGNEIILPYSIAQFVFAISTLLSGRWVDRKGPRITLMVGGLLYGSGLILSSFVTEPWMLYLTYGVFTGAGVGFVYVCPLATLIKWFPKNRGAITGLSVGVFGGGSILFQNVISGFLTTTDVSGAFLKLGLVSMALILFSALLTKNPEGFVRSAPTKGQGDYTPLEMMKTANFKIIWVMFWMAVIPGLLILGAAKNIGIEVAGLDALAAAAVISILAVANAGSRLASGALSDKVGTLNMLRVVFAVTIVSLLALGLLANIQAAFYLGACRKS